MSIVSGPTKANNLLTSYTFTDERNVYVTEAIFCHIRDYYSMQGKDMQQGKKRMKEILNSKL